MKLAFLKGEGFVAKMIRLWTRGPYSHVELVFSDMVAFSCAQTDSMHTRFQNIYFDTKYWTLVDVNVSEEDEKKIRTWCESEVGCAYDWTGIILSQFIPFGYQSKTKWFCSEVCVAALQQVGLFPKIKAWRVSPNKLYKLIS